MSELQHGILQWLAVLVVGVVSFMAGWFAYRQTLGRRIYARFQKEMMKRDVDRLARSKPKYGEGRPR